MHTSAESVVPYQFVENEEEYSEDSARYQASSSLSLSHSAHPTAETVQHDRRSMKMNTWYQ